MFDWIVPCCMTLVNPTLVWWNYIAILEDEESKPQIKSVTIISILKCANKST